MEQPASTTVFISPWAQDNARIAKKIPFSYFPFYQVLGKATIKTDRTCRMKT